MNEPDTLLARYRRLSEISRDLASTLDLEDLLDSIVHAAADLCQAQAASILLYDHVRQELRFAAASNLAEPEMKGLVVPVESSLAGWVVTTRQTVNSADTPSDPRHFNQIEDATHIRTHSLLAVPLVAKEKVVGALEAINKRRGDFNREDEDLLLALAAQAAVAIENARLFQQSDLIREMVHELRTPLAALRTATHLLVDERTSPESRARLASMLGGEVDRLDDMTTAFLDLARLESGRARFKLQAFDLASLVEQCGELVAARARERGLRLELQLEPRLIPVKADRDKLQQVILNLLTNAIKYNRPDGAIFLRADTLSNEILVQVADTGRGISPDDLPHIFEKFYRVAGVENEIQGTGLGLSICKRIIEAHHGRISVESTLGQGSEFSIYLPM